MRKIEKNQVYAAGLSLTTGLIVFLIYKYVPPAKLSMIAGYMFATIFITFILFLVGAAYWQFLDYLAQRRQAKIAAVLKRLIKEGEMKDGQ